MHRFYRHPQKAPSVNHPVTSRWGKLISPLQSKIRMRMILFFCLIQIVLSALWLVLYYIAVEMPAQFSKADKGKNRNQ